MKKLFLLLLFLTALTQAQIVNIPDPIFKAKLLAASPSNQIAFADRYCKIDTNNDGEIQVSEALVITLLNVSGAAISNLTGIESFINLESLNISYTQLSNVEISQNSKLRYLTCKDNSQLINLNLTQNLELRELLCENNIQLTNLNITQNLELRTLWCNNIINLTNLDLTHNLKLRNLQCNNNINLTNLDLTHNLKLRILKCNNNSQITSLVCVSSYLRTFECFSNQLSALDVTNCVNLQTLRCDNNQLTNLDVTHNTHLTTLHCYSNQLTALNLANNSLLAGLKCYDNFISALDLSHNPDLISLNCRNNHLTVLNIKNKGIQLLDDLNFSNNPNLSYICADIALMSAIQSLAGTGITVDSNCPSEPDFIVNIPDPVLKAKLLAADVSNSTASLNNVPTSYVRIDANNDGEIQFSEIKSIRYLNLQGSSTLNGGIADMTGIESFKNLATFYCGYNQLTALDVTNNLKLNKLYCNNNQFFSLDVSNNLYLNRLNCEYNQLSTLNLYYNEESLDQLECGYNNLTSIDLEEGYGLHYIKFDHNQIASIDFSESNWIRYIYCNDNLLTSLDLSVNCGYLRELYCNNNQLTSLLLRPLNNITILECKNNLLTSLNVGYIATGVIMDRLYCSNNQITNLNVARILKELDCSNNQLTALNVTTYQLVRLDCSNNQLTALTVPTFTNQFVHLDCSNNQLTNLNIEEDNGMRELFCSNNQFTNLNLRGNVGLETIACDFNQLTSLDLMRNVNLQTLTCTSNQLTNLLIKNESIETSLDFSNNPNLSYICADAAQVATVQTLAGAGVTVDSECVLGIAENQTQKAITIFPNPAQTMITIVSTSILKSIQLLDMQGRLLVTKPIHETQTDFDISSYNNGIYFVKVTTDTGSQVEKIIKE